jgi:tetratricopeptide (TPR) repeat protein
MGPDPALEAALLTAGLRVERTLGAGGFGVVVLATRLADGLEVAVKVAASTGRAAQENLKREAAAMSRVGPPYVPRVYAEGECLGRAYLVMAQLTSSSLADLMLLARGPLPLPQFVRIVDALLESVRAIHAVGIAHRDLKPENIFVPESGPATVIDFGLAHDQREPGSVETVVEGIGTAEYMSPEQCDGVSDADPGADLYSLGCLFYEMLTGAPPFWGLATDVREAQRSKRPAAFPASVPGSRELEQLVRRCLAKERARRYSDVRELQDALRSAISARARSLTPRRPGAEDTMATMALPAPVPAAGQREKRSVGLLYFESRAGVGVVQSVVTSCGGQLAQAQGVQYVAAFGHEVADNPLRSALIAAQRLISASHTQRVLVDVASVSIHVRPDGTRRMFSAAFARKDGFPKAADPEGTQLTKAACEVLPDLKIVPLVGRSDRWLCDASEDAAEPTTLGLSGAALVGREAPLAQLGESMERAFAQRLPTLVTIVGEQGHGKTHFASAVGRLIEQREPAARLIRLTARDGSGSALRQLLRRTLQLPVAAPPDGGRALLIERLGEKLSEQVWAAAALSLGWIDAGHPDVRRLAAAPGALRSAAARAAGEALRRLAHERTIGVLLDDADRVDDATLDALEYATLREAGAPLWAAVLVRPSFARARPAWGTRAGHSERISLPPLDRDACAELARRLLQPVEYVPPVALERLAQRTQGIPFLLVELIAGLKRDGFIRRSERGTGHYLATEELDQLPDLPVVQWSASREVEALAPELAGYARLASILGSAFAVSEMEALLVLLERDAIQHDTQLDAGVGVRRLVDAGLLVRHRSGLIDFRHSLLRETIYRSVPEAQRQRLHAAAFEMYQSQPSVSELQREQLPLHAARAGEKTLAAAHYLALARQSADAHAYLTAEAAFDGALENLPETDREGQVSARSGRGLMRFRLGRHEDALKDLHLAWELARELGDSAQQREILMDESTVLDWTRAYAQSAARVREVEKAGVHGDGGLLEAKLSMGLSRIYHREGNAELAVPLGARAAEQAAALGDLGYETRIIALTMMASDLANLGRLDEAESCFETVIAEATAHGDFLHLGGAHGNRALLWFARKLPERLFEDLGRSIQIAREMGYPLLEYLGACNVSEVRYAMGDLEQAERNTERSLELVRQLWGEASLEIGTRQLLLARVALYRADLAAAGRWVADIRGRLASETQRGSDLQFSTSELVLLEMVELALRDYDAPAWDTFLARAAAVDLQPMEEVEVLECRALCALRHGQREEAVKHFEAALRVSAEKPNLLSERVARRFRECLGHAA